ncbi:unnamed protein product [Didymodactylos carnosus]|uniref:Uncharacterized protein n=1 Tax=Didymodactylos carnosus TaxID=1234261 RepID=A0A814PSY5_9BILA|nr:unnamed protein product [Didymodactylos carnosus]CAF3874761.1 unnamed protein product [Didymodactylos carnosus]
MFGTTEPSSPKDAMFGISEPLLSPECDEGSEISLESLYRGSEVPFSEGSSKAYFRALEVPLERLVGPPYLYTASIMIYKPNQGEHCFGRFFLPCTSTQPHRPILTIKGTFLGIK